MGNNYRGGYQIIDITNIPYYFEVGEDYQQSTYDKYVEEIKKMVETSKNVGKPLLLNCGSISLVNPTLSIVGDYIFIRYNKIPILCVDNDNSIITNYLKKTEIWNTITTKYLSVSVRSCDHCKVRAICV